MLGSIKTIKSPKIFSPLSINMIVFYEELHLKVTFCASFRG